MVSGSVADERLLELVPKVGCSRVAVVESPLLNVVLVQVPEKLVD